MKAMNGTVVDPIPDNFEMLEEAAEFWDTHDFADYQEFTHDVEIEVDLKYRRHIVVAEALVPQVMTVAQRQGISVESLVNLWIAERLQTLPTI